MSCGASHVLAVTNENEVFSWGKGDNGEIKKKLHISGSFMKNSCHN